MSDQSVRAALRSDAPLVVIEAPAGCGKTHQGALLAVELALTSGKDRALILTHTHAACSVFAERVRASASRVEIRTTDSLIAQIAAAYHSGLGLPSDVPRWVRRQKKDGHDIVSLRVAQLLDRHPSICKVIAKRYPTIICDEHQDSSGDQHGTVMAVHRHGAKLRIFADPMQSVYKNPTVDGARQAYPWDQLCNQANAYEDLDTPHRWSSGCGALGEWILAARGALKNGDPIAITANMPRSVSVVYAENTAQTAMGFQVSTNERRFIDQFVRREGSLLVLTRHNDTASSLRSFFNRRFPIWEGHTRDALDKLASAVTDCTGDSPAIGSALLTFLQSIGAGFSDSNFGRLLQREVKERCARRTRGKPELIQGIASMILAEPNQHGVANALKELSKLRSSNPAFSDMKIDKSKEFWDAIRLGCFENVDEGIAELTQRRSYSRMSPPQQAISTIHKAKGLECDNVLLLPCDARTFPDNQVNRCLLYVALSRAKSRLQIVLSRNNPSPLFTLSNR